MKTFTPPALDESWPESAQAAHQQFSKQIELLNKAMDKLKRQLELDSTTSSKPPSTDEKKGKARRKRRSSGRSKGGQKGHTGSTRERLEPDEVIVCEPQAERCACGGEWIAREQKSLLQVTDLPEIKPHVREYHRACFDCPDCGQSTYADSKLPLGDSHFGPRIHALVLDLSLSCRLSHRQIRDHLKRSFNIKVSIGTISSMIERAGQLTQNLFEELKRWYQQDDRPKHVDETGWRIQGERTQLIGSLNGSAAIFQCSEKRKQPDVMSLIGDNLKQLIICDRALVYHGWENRQLCWAHVLRDFYCLETYPASQRQATALVKSAQALFKHFRAHQQGSLSTEAYLKNARQLRTKIKAALQRLEKIKIAEKPDGMVRSLLKHEAKLWTFLDHPSLCIHNNLQESALRPLVIKLKLSFGNDTEEGADRLAQLMSVVETLKRQGRDVLSWLVACFEGQPTSLIPSR